MQQNTTQKSAHISRGKKIGLALLASLPLPLSLFLLGPLDLFASNAGEFGFSVGDFILPCLLAFLLASLFLSASVFLPDRAFSVAFPILTGLSLAVTVTSWIGGNGGLPGDRLHDLAVGKAVFGIALFLLLATLPTVIALVFKKNGTGFLVCCVLSGALLFSGLAGILPLCFSLGGDADEPDERQEGGTLTGEGLDRLGDERNVLYFVIDRLDEDFLRVAEETEPGFFSDLDGFTRYTDHISLYSNTYPAILYMLTQKEADFTAIREVNFKNCYPESRLLSALDAADYEIGIYTESYYCFGDAENLLPFADNIASNGTTVTERKTDLAFEMMALSLYRSLPSAFGGLFSSLSSETFSSHRVFRASGGGDLSYPFSNGGVADRLSGAKFHTGTEKRFSFIHIAGMHDVLDGRDDPDLTVRRLSECFAIVDRYLDALREKGLYRDATVVITGDHPSPIDDFAKLDAPRQTGLFVKRSGDDSEGYRTSDKQVSQGQIYAEILDSEGFSLRADDAIPLSQTQEGTIPRVHHFIMRTGSGKFRLLCYTVIGVGSDFGNWQFLPDDSPSYGKDPYD